MLWNAFMCGFVGSLGAALGVTVAWLALSIIRNPRNEQAAARIDKANELLERRNKLTEETITYLAGFGISLQHVAVAISKAVDK